MRSSKDRGICVFAVFNFLHVNYSIVNDIFYFKSTQLACIYRVSVIMSLRKVGHIAIPTTESICVFFVVGFLRRFEKIEIYVVTIESIIRKKYSTRIIIESYGNSVCNFYPIGIHFKMSVFNIAFDIFRTYLLFPCTFVKIPSIKKVAVHLGLRLKYFLGFFNTQCIGNDFIVTDKFYTYTLFFFTGDECSENNHCYH